jgi:hypothetical protein
MSGQTEADVGVRGPSQQRTVEIGQRKEASEGVETEQKRKEETKEASKHSALLVRMREAVMWWLKAKRTTRHWVPKSSLRLRTWPSTLVPKDDRQLLGHPLAGNDKIVTAWRITDARTRGGPIILFNTTRCSSPAAEPQFSSLGGRDNSRSWALLYHSTCNHHGGRRQSFSPAALARCPDAAH